MIYPFFKYILVYIFSESEMEKFLQILEWVIPGEVIINLMMLGKVVEKGGMLNTLR